ncbi:MAG: transporter [Myxococcota bacterium]
MHRAVVVSALLIWLGSGGSPAYAEERLGADRPGFAQATTSVPRGRTVLELAASLQAELEGLADPRVNLPQALLRVGLPLNFEVRVQVPSVVIRPDADAGSSTLSDESEVGVTELGVGAKYSLGLGEALGLSSVLALTLPIQINDFGVSDEVTARLGVNLDWRLFEALTLTAAGYLGWAESEAQVGVGGVARLHVGSVDLFVQVFGQRDAASEEFDFDAFLVDLSREVWSVAVGGGVTFMPNDRLQLFISADVYPYREARTSLGAVVVADPLGVYTDDRVRLVTHLGAAVSF